MVYIFYFSKQHVVTINQAYSGLIIAPEFPPRVDGGYNYKNDHYIQHNCLLKLSSELLIRTNGKNIQNITGLTF